jgi:hypothetical protein
MDRPVRVFAAGLGACDRPFAATPAHGTVIIDHAEALLPAAAAG